MKQVQQRINLILQAVALKGHLSHSGKLISRNCSECGITSLPEFPFLNLQTHPA
jgi:hypothetical protein